jgi:hypothetical protein
MLLATLVLVSVDCEHDGLEQCIDLGHGDQSTKMRNVPWLGLQQEQQIAVLLRLVVVGKETFLQFHAFFEVARDFVLLGIVSDAISDRMYMAYLFQRHAVLNQQGYPRVEIAHVLLEHKVLLRLRRDLGLEFAENLLGCEHH